MPGISDYDIDSSIDMCYIKSMEDIMKKLMVLFALIASGCSYYDSTEYEVTYSVSSSVPCSIEYLNESFETVKVDNVTDFTYSFKLKYFYTGTFDTPEFVIKERFCLGTIGISINGQGVSKTIGVSCCCEDELRYRTRIN